MSTGWTAAESNERTVSRAHLVPHGDFAGTIHSVFATACNIAVGELLITVHDSAKQHTPTSVRVAPDGPGHWTPIVSVGDPANCRSAWLSFGDHVLDLRQVPIWTPDLPPRPIQAEVARQRLTQLVRAHQIPVTHASSAMTSTLAHDVAALRDILTAVAETTAVSAADLDSVIGRLIGAGEGLTPTGDDVLVGLLAALYRGGEMPLAAAVYSPVGEAVLRHTHRTTDISAHYLRLATRGSFGEPLTNLVDAVIGGASVDDVHARTSDVLSVGASSGADALVGVLLGLEAVLELPVNKKAA